MTPVQNPYFESRSLKLPPLPYPVYFVTKDPKWHDLIENPELAFDDAMYGRCMLGHDMWSAQVYLDLKRQGLDVHLVSRPLPGRICVIPYYYLRSRDWLHRSYVLACRHDTPNPVLCHQQTVMNHGLVKSPRHHCMPHRPQPGLQPRDRDRGSRVENLVFKGHSYNLAAPFRSPEFLAELDRLGIHLALNTEAGQTAFQDWADYRDADVVMAVRNVTTFDVRLKPGLKLVNAWLAGCPAILSPEPAYQEMRRSDLDFFEVRTAEEAIAALKALKNDPDLYQAMVNNGFERARDYTTAQVITAWHDLLSGPVARGYADWQQRSAWQQHVVDPVIYRWQMVQHRLQQKYYQYWIHNGKRILDPS